MVAERGSELGVEYRKGLFVYSDVGIWKAGRGRALFAWSYHARFHSSIYLKSYTEKLDGSSSSADLNMSQSVWSAASSRLKQGCLNIPNSPRLQKGACIAALPTLSLLRTLTTTTQL